MKNTEFQKMDVEAFSRKYGYSVFSIHDFSNEKEYNEHRLYVNLDHITKNNAINYKLKNCAGEFISGRLSRERLVLIFDLLDKALHMKEKMESLNDKDSIVSLLRAIAEDTASCYDIADKEVCKRLKKINAARLRILDASVFHVFSNNTTQDVVGRLNMVVDYLSIGTRPFLELEMKRLKIDREEQDIEQQAKHLEEKIDNQNQQENFSVIEELINDKEVKKLTSKSMWKGIGWGLLALGGVAAIGASVFFLGVPAVGLFIASTAAESSTIMLLGMQMSTLTAGISAGVIAVSRVFTSYSVEQAHHHFSSKGRLMEVNTEKKSGIKKTEKHKNDIKIEQEKKSILNQYQPKRNDIYTFKKDNNAMKFSAHKVKDDSFYGLTCIGINRKELCELLQNSITKQKVGSSLCNDIYNKLILAPNTDILGQDQKLNNECQRLKQILSGLESRLRYYREQENKEYIEAYTEQVKKLTTNLKNFFISKKVCELYVNYLSKNGVWLGDNVISAAARSRKLNIKIYSEENSEAKQSRIIKKYMDYNNSSKKTCHILRTTKNNYRLLTVAVNNDSKKPGVKIKNGMKLKNQL